MYHPDDMNRNFDLGQGGSQNVPPDDMNFIVFSIRVSQLEQAVISNDFKNTRLSPTIPFMLVSLIFILSIFQAVAYYEPSFFKYLATY